MIQNIKNFTELTKFGIVVFVLITGVAGYFASFTIETTLSATHLLYFIFGLYALSSGSLALNQVQDYDMDRLMERTAKRPLVTGFFTKQQAATIALALLIIGLYCLLICSKAAFFVGLISVLLYNGVYTYVWKRKWAFGAIPGAVPGALPVTIGFAANDPNIFHIDSVYMFLIMFLWQVPHFWILAIRYKDDYAKGGVPVLPIVIGEHRTIWHIGVYTFLFVLVALASPIFVSAGWVYLGLVLPTCFYILWEFKNYLFSEGKTWLRFFMVLNLAMLLFLIVPIIDRYTIGF